MSIPSNVWMRCAKDHKAGVRRADATSMYCARCKKIVRVTPDYTLVVSVTLFKKKIDDNVVEKDPTQVV